MAENKRNFDTDAASWEDNPMRVRLAEQIVGAIADQIVLTSDMMVMDFGCGTGLISRRILPFVHSVVGVDSSPGMLEMFKRKAAEGGLGGIGCRLVHIDNGDVLSGNYDVVVSGMTLHHVHDPKPLLDQFYQVISPGGYLCIADLDPDDGEFHADATGVFHNGFERGFLRQSFIDAGFDVVSQTTATEVAKPSRSGEARRFTVALTVGKKSAVVK
jgi:2-polyprenyl-3-methyl-5-hydroxy-6-metoxy-1,4-benzoquinol methylase